MIITTEEAIQRLQPWREQWKLTAWKPITQDVETSITDSKFAGTPWLSRDEPWPACPDCHTRLPLFLQLNLSHLPFEHIFGSGLIQLFYCVECDSAYEAFSSTSLVRIVHPDHFETTQTPPAASFPTKTIVDWASFNDFPNPQDHRKLGVDYIYGGLDPFEATVVSPEQGIVFTVLDDDELAEHISQAATGDKLVGWPHWIQGADYPECPQCAQQMHYIFQLDSEDHLPFLFGDLGTGHITQCPVHKDVVAFGWNAS